MEFLALPRELRDMIYSLLVPDEEEKRVYTMNCRERKAETPSLLHIIDRAEDSTFGILWTSQIIRYELLTTICAKCTFRFTLPKAIHDSTTTKSTAVVIPHSLSQRHIDMLQRVEIHMDVLLLPSHIDTLPLRMSRQGDVKRKICKVKLTNEDNRLFTSFLELGFPRVMLYLVGFETVLVEGLEQKTIVGFSPRFFVETVLGPSFEFCNEGGVLCCEFHPREFCALGGGD